MPLAVTLCLDPAAAGRVERLWQALFDRLGEDDTRSLGYRPHVTLAILPDSAPLAPLDAAVRILATAAEAAIPITLSGLAVFPGTPPVLWAAPAPTRRLLALHARLLAALDTLPVHPHYRPGAWVPHVTLAKNSRADAHALLQAALPAWDGPVHGLLDRIDLVRFRPVEVLHSEALGPPERAALA